MYLFRQTINTTRTICKGILIDFTSKGFTIDVIAKLIKESIEAKNPKTRYAGGSNAKQILLIRKIVSDKILDKIIMSQYK